MQPKQEIKTCALADFCFTGETVENLLNSVGLHPLKTTNPFGGYLPEELCLNPVKGRMVASAIGAGFLPVQLQEAVGRSVMAHLEVRGVLLERAGTALDISSNDGLSSSSTVNNVGRARLPTICGPCSLRSSTAESLFVNSSEDVLPCTNITEEVEPGH